MVRSVISLWKGAYAVQKWHAEARGIEFKLTFDEWYGIWNNSGHLLERGRERGQYVMARNKDKGPYSLDNVRIILHEDNAKESWTNRSNIERCIKISHALIGKKRGPMTDETKAKIRLANTGKVRNAKTRMLLSITHQSPRSALSAETKAKISNALRGRKSPAKGSGEQYIFRGIRKNAAGWATELGISTTAFKLRIKHKMPINLIFSKGHLKTGPKC